MEPEPAMSFKSSVLSSPPASRPQASLQYYTVPIRGLPHHLLCHHHEHLPLTLKTPLLVLGLILKSYPQVLPVLGTVGTGDGQPETLSLLRVNKSHISSYLVSGYHSRGTQVRPNGTHSK